MLFIVLLASLLWPLRVVTQIQSPLNVSKESEVDINNYTGIVSEQYANGLPALWKTLIDGKTEGIMLEWYPNGNLRYRANWKNNMGNGKWEYFYPNGKLKSESFYVNDMAQGIYREYHENGKLKMDATYMNNQIDGVELKYDKSGVLLSRKRYDDGTEVIDEPIIFEPGVISADHGNEWGITFMPDGNTAYFTRRDLLTGKKRIYQTTKTKDLWSIPTIASFSTDEDEAAFVNKEGTQFYFSSYRPLLDGSTTELMDNNIWVMDMTKNGWANPRALSSTINQSMQKGNAWPANYEAGPMTDNDGNLYFWTKGSKSNATNLYFSKLQSNGLYAAPLELIEPSSSANYDTAPHLSPDGNLLFFGSDDRSDGYGGSDIYFSKKVGGKWSKPKNLGPVINSSRNEGFPSFSPDGKYFFFSSNRGDKVDDEGDYLWDIYYMETRFLLID